MHYVTETWYYEFDTGEIIERTFLFLVYSKREWRMTRKKKRRQSSAPVPGAAGETTIPTTNS